MSDNIFKYPLLIREIHLDVFGHVNNATYLALFEEARWELITQKGYGLKHIMETGLGPVILEINIKFLKELRLRDKIEIETQVLSSKNKIAKMMQKILREGKICCTAELSIALFDLKERKLVEPTQDWLHAMGIEFE